MNKVFLFFIAGLLLVVSPAFAQVGLTSMFPGPGTPASTATPYVAPCNGTTVISTGCAAAVSVARDMTGTATNAFRLYNGTSTLDVGFTSHVVDLSGIPAFCKLIKDCKIVPYEQVGGTLIPAATVGNNRPGPCVATQDCAADFYLDTATGLPILITPYPTEYDVLDTNITGGTAAVSVWSYGRNEGFPAEFGTGHDPTAGLINGTDFLNLLYYGNTFASGYIRCSAANAYCLGADEETSVEPYTASCTGGTCPPNGVGTTYATGVLGNVYSMMTYAGSNGAVKGYVNSATPLFSEANPSSFTYNSSSLSPGQHLKIGCGGDCTQSAVVMRDGIVANGVLSATDYTALKTNTDSFYAGHTTAAACHGAADLDYLMWPAAISSRDFGVYFPPGGGWLAYALAQVRAAYFGPLATLKRTSDNTSQTFSSALAAGGVGCGLEAAAATFCNATTCSITTLYNQGTLSAATTQLGNVHDTGTDAACTNVTVTFSGLNGLPVMHFAGNGFCSAPLVRLTSGYLAYGAVAQRTGNTSAFQAVYDSVSGFEIELGFNNSAGNAFYYSAGGSLQTQAATDNHWHDMYMETTGGVNFGPYTDNVAGTTIAKAGANYTAAFTFGGKDASTQNLTGDIAEIDVISVSDGSSAGYTSHAGSIFAAHEATWGTLPN